MFRSEEMHLCQLFVQPEAAYAIVAELGEIGCIQFRDLNADVNAFQRSFATELRRCDELERRIRYISNELERDQVQLRPLLDAHLPAAPKPKEIIDLEAKLESTENEIRELSVNTMNLNMNLMEMLEMKEVLEYTDKFFMNYDVYTADNEHLDFVAGVIKLEKYFALERMLWRITRGNVYLKRNDLNSPLKDPKTGDPVIKTVFIAFFQGDQLKQRVKKVCAGFHASLYPCPSVQGERQNMISDVHTRLQDLTVVLQTTDDHRMRVLLLAAQHLPKWTVMIKKMKAVYYTLNMFSMNNKYMIGEGWVPTNDLNSLHVALAQGTKIMESTIPSFFNIIETNEQPPTFTRTNKFTRGFQNLIDAYGVASYREVNPAFYTCITFPFLFAVMFGDFGHGLLLALFALVLIFREKQLSNVKGEIFNIFFGGRYIILLMGFFSLYTGFIYNDIFSKSMNIFGTTWRASWKLEKILNNTFMEMDPAKQVSGVYPIGLDPIWQLAENKIIFLNTYKMKLSIIFGVMHMIFGVCMSLINDIHFRKYINIIMEFVPQVIFLTLLFGYMVFMMFYKWVKYSAKTKVFANSPGCAPSILILFINMMLFKHQQPLDGCKEYMFDGQEIMQTAFVIVAIICIPWMLLGKPIYCMCKTGNSKKSSSKMHDDDIEAAPSTAATSQSITGHGHDGADEPMGEILIQQAIHTIEYVLSTISHTASYLRLWALSLAHAQLSEVLWGMVFAMSFSIQNYGGSIFLFVIFAFWAILTIGILVLIEGLSAFLHTLRLHWVEFMSKFYEGLGYAFQPFHFKIILQEADE